MNNKTTKYLQLKLLSVMVFVCIALFFPGNYLFAQTKTQVNKTLETAPWLKIPLASSNQLEGGHHVYNNWTEYGSEMVGKRAKAGMFLTILDGDGSGKTISYKLQSDWVTTTNVPDKLQWKPMVNSKDLGQMGAAKDDFLQWNGAQWLPKAISGMLNYRGSFDPTISNGYIAGSSTPSPVLKNGDYYISSKIGVVNLTTGRTNTGEAVSVTTSIAPGDWVLFNGTKWQKLIGTTAQKLTDLNDVVLDATPKNNDILSYDETSGMWKNKTALWKDLGGNLMTTTIEDSRIGIGMNPDANTDFRLTVKNLIKAYSYTAENPVGHADLNFKAGTQNVATIYQDIIDGVLKFRKYNGTEHKFPLVVEDGGIGVGGGHSDGKALKVHGDAQVTGALSMDAIISNSITTKNLTVNGWPNFYNDNTLNSNDPAARLGLQSGTNTPWHLSQNSDGAFAMHVSGIGDIMTIDYNQRQHKFNGWGMFYNNATMKTDPAARLGLQSGTNTPWWLSQNSDGVFAMHLGGIGDKLTLNTAGDLSIAGNFSIGGAFSPNTMQTRYLNITNKAADVSNGYAVIRFEDQNSGQQTFIGRDKNDGKFYVENNGHATFQMNSNGNVGIGGPSENGRSLKVHGQFLIDGWNIHEISNNLRFVRGGNTVDFTPGGRILINGGDHFDLIKVHSTSNLFDWDGHAKGRNNNTGTYAIQASGGGIAAHWFYAYSDKRIKSNINTVKEVLPTLKKLNVVSYDKHYYSGNKSFEVGLIAQDLYKVIPEAVHLTPGKVLNENGQWVEVDDFHSIDYSMMSMLNLKAIQELSNQNNDLRRENDELRTKVKKMELLLENIIKKLDKH
jgi:hypothetical protein